MIDRTLAAPCPPIADSRVRDILRVGAIVVPWLCAVILPVILLTGFYASVGRLLFFDFVMMPFANVAYLALSLGGEGAFGWVAFLFFAGVVCPPALALAFVRWWRSRAFWLVWAGYLAFVAESAVLATLHAFLLSSLNNLNNLLEGLRL